MVTEQIAHDYLSRLQKAEALLKQIWLDKAIDDTTGDVLYGLVCAHFASIYDDTDGDESQPQLGE